MSNFWESSVWGSINLFAVLLLSLLIANLLKKSVKVLKRSLIPTSVLGGLLLLIIINIYKALTGESMLDTPFFGGKGSSVAEIITYHCLALGFIATVFKPIGEKAGKKRVTEVFNTGVTTVSSYLLQGVLGLGITIAWAAVSTGVFSGAGILLPFGFGQGTGQALNWGSIYETDNGFVGGRSFGLTVAALGFLSAAIGGVIHLNILGRRGKIKSISDEQAEVFASDDVQKNNEIPMNGSIDKLTVQLGFIFVTYMFTYIVIFLLGEAAHGLRSILYGFNFLIGVIIGALISVVIGGLRKRNVIKKEYINTFLMKRISGFFFDMMIVAGVAAIKIDMIKDYWLMLLVLAFVGAFSTYFYNRLVVKKLFTEYPEEQFLVMYGMLTGTASTGIILLREIDRNFSTPAADNLVYQNFPAIVFGFPLMLLAAMVPKNPTLVLLILAGFFLVMNIILFRSFIFRKKKQ